MQVFFSDLLQLYNHNVHILQRGLQLSEITVTIKTGPGQLPRIYNRQNINYEIVNTFGLKVDRICEWGMPVKPHLDFLIACLRYRQTWNLSNHYNPKHFSSVVKPHCTSATPHITLPSVYPHDTRTNNEEHSDLSNIQNIQIHWHTHT